MCGIFGFFTKPGAEIISKEKFHTMGDVIHHRGPDGNGAYTSSDNRVALGNNRLAIIDVDNGRQPFVSDDGKIAVVQNGEIFNYVELKQEMQSSGINFNTDCDTEVILRLYENYGLKSLEKMNGMFAIAIYDQAIDSIILIRDRVGEKPLYWCCYNGSYLFASEIKSILEVTGSLEYSNDAINAYLTYNYVPPPITMFSGVEHVLPGHRLIISGSGVVDECWWDLNKITTIDRSEDDWSDHFINLLDDAVRIRLRSDVDFGAFLSGGVDSSTVVGLMSRHMGTPVKSFNIGFSDPKYDESPFALEAAKRFGCEHYSEIVDPDLFDQWSESIYFCDQPHGDVSFLPTKKVSEMASRHVKMVLTGDGADELFAGYDKYKSIFKDDALTVDDACFYKSFCNSITLFSDDAKKSLYSKSFIANLSTKDVHGTFIKPKLDKVKNFDRVNQVLYVDMFLLLPGNNLVKPDRMGMAHSIENRAPFLDYRFMEFAFSIPGYLKLKNEETKYIYKKSVSSLIGSHLAYRKKQMFTVPVGDWFKTKLRPLCEDLLLSSKTRSRGIFNYDFVEKMLNDHCNDLANYTREIRALMALEIWFRRFGY